MADLSMEYCPNCGNPEVEGMKFCPRCGQALIGLGPEQKQRYVAKSEAPLKEKNWFERHLNWTMFLALAGVYVGGFVVGLLIASADPYVSDDVLYIVGIIVSVAILIPVWGWALRKKNRSLGWLPLGLFVPFGWVALLCLENRSQISKPPELNPQSL